MKKLLLIGLLLLPLKLYAGTTDYYELQHFIIDPSTQSNTNDLRLRGNLNIYDDTSTYILNEATPTVRILANGDIEAGTIVVESTTTLFTNGITFSSWTVHEASSTFNQDVSMQKTMVNGTATHESSVTIKNNMLADNILSNYSIVGSSLSLSSHTHIEAYLSSSQGDCTTGKYTHIEFNTEAHDYLNEFSTSDSSFTATTAGFYYILLQVNMDLDDGDTIVPAIYYNGTAKFRTIITFGGGSECVIQTSALMKLNVDDKLSFFAYHNHGSARTLQGGGIVGQQCYLTILRLF